jgi:hypothetical protein
LVNSLAALVVALGANPATGKDATSAILDALIRRLGANAATTSDADALIAMLVEEIDPIGGADGIAPRVRWFRRATGLHDEGKATAA